MGELINMLDWLNNKTDDTDDPKWDFYITKLQDLTEEKTNAA